MNYTKYEKVNEAVSNLSQKIKDVLGDKVVGLYLYGSSVWGDFDEGISDIDLLAATTEVISESDLKSLESMHKEFVSENKEWEDRIEVQYQSLEGLKSFREKETKMANISPGEPLHFLNAGKDWLMNWYFVQEYGVTIFGKKPSEIIPPITQKEFIEKIREAINFWEKNVSKSSNSLKYQGYVIMTLSRSLYSLEFQKQVSKKVATDWIVKEYPEWEALIEKAFIWRKNFRGSQAGAEQEYPSTENFVKFVITESKKL